MNFYEWFVLNEGRVIEPFFSKAHIFTVTFFLFHCVVILFYLGRKYKDNPKAIEKIMKVVAFIMISLYVLEITRSITANIHKGLDLTTAKGLKTLRGMIVNNVPLYLCDVAIWAIPIIAFTKGKARTICSDFMAIWGLPMGIIGTYLAGNIFGVVPVFSFDGLLAIFLHVVPAAFTVFLYVTKLASLERKNILMDVIAFTAFMTFVLIYDYIFNPLNGTNFMFFFHGEGTPFDLFKPYVPLVVYQIIVFVLYFSYHFLFLIIFNAIRDAINKKKQTKITTSEPVVA